MNKKRNRSKLELQRNIISEISKEFDFEEKIETKSTENESEVINIQTVTKGIFKTEDNYLAIICKDLEIDKYPRGIKNAFKNKFLVKNIYQGEKFLLCNDGNDIYAYNISFFEKSESFLNELDSITQNLEKKYWVGNDLESPLHILIIETEIAYYLIAGLVSDNQLEEERVLLSNKLESSQPFFQFKAPISFDWNKLIGDKDRQFERICELLLQRDKNIKRVIPIGKTRAADRGRDFEVIEKIENFGKEEERKWLVQCKFSEYSISPKIISGWTDRVIEHKYDGYWLMTNNDITPNLFDQFKDVKLNDNFEIKTRFWQRSDFQIKLNVHSELFINNDIFELD